MNRLLASPEGAKFKRKRSEFTRDGPLTPSVLVALLLKLVSQGDRRGYGHLLEEFWADAADHGVQLGREVPVTAPAFCKARRRLRPDLFRWLLHEVGCQTDASEGRDITWKGRRVFAADGSTATVRRSAELWAHFGAAEGSYYPQASVVALSDVLSGVVYDVSIAPYGTSERESLKPLLELLNPGDVLLLDRGYPSFELLDALDRLGIDFVIRMPMADSWPRLQNFLDSGRSETLQYLPLSKTIDQSRHRGIMVRYVRCERPGEEPVILVTSLKRDEASPDELEELYHLRWAIEETYKLPKGLYLNQRQLHAQYVEGVEQEILALYLFISLARTMRREAAAAEGQDHRDLSQKAAILATGRHLAVLVIARVDSAAWTRAYVRTIQRIMRCRDPRRPDRSYPRRSFQPRRRWGPRGRVGKVG